MTKHTPGPWFVVEGSVNGRWPSGCESAIDDVDGGNPERDYFLASVVHGDPDELLANAHLVAAAPRLLAALRGMLREHDALTIATGGKPGVTDRWSERATAARAAIAAAEGKE
ncbi:MAG: hypothetical protein WC322_03795 [Candidatus Paceibacterota bacterium]|jgi:hypothetical protein